jgi:Fe2+ transport system protein FeoA
MRTLTDTAAPAPVATAEPAAVPLCEMCPGQVCRFYEASLDTTTASFLRALGLTRTCELRVCQNGEPCIVQVRSTRIGLSRAVADQIYVIPVQAQEK